MKKGLYLLLLLTFAAPVQSEYRDPCVDRFVSNNGDIETAFFLIGTCVLGIDGTDNTEVAKRHNQIKVPTAADRGDNRRQEVQEQVRQFFDAVYDRQAESLAEVKAFPDILQAQKILDKLIKDTATDIFLKDGTFDISIDHGFSYSASIAPELDRPRWTTTGFKSNKYAVHFRDIVVGTTTTSGACVTDLKSAVCRLALESMVDWIRFQKAVTTNVHRSYNNDKLFDFQEYLADRAKRWKNFFEVSNYPFLWEVGINQNIESFNYERGVYGLSEPPTKQLTIFRPSVAAGFQNGTGELPHMELVVELIGVSSWKWAGTEAVDRWGVSLIATYTERSSNGDTEGNSGVGILFHTPTPGVSFGLVDRDKGDDGLVVTFDFLRLFDERKKQFEMEKQKLIKAFETKIRQRVAEWE